MAQNETQNYTLGRGEIYFARFADAVNFVPAGERYIGNSPELSLTISQEVLDHFSSDRGIREKDASIPLQVDRTGSFSTDNIHPENVAMFFFGESQSVVEAGGTITSETVAPEGAEQGLYYQLGVSEARPTGAKGLIDTDDSNSGGSFTVFENDSNSGAGVAFVKGTDYEIDYDSGRLYIIPDGGIADGTVLSVTYVIKASTFARVISGSAPVAGAMRYIQINPQGTNFDYYFPYVKVSPNGDYALKGDDWQVIPFNLEILKLTGKEAIYMDGRPIYA